MPPCRNNVPLKIPGIGPGCNSSQFECTNGQCISSSSRCTGVRTCSDGSDEMNCCRLCILYLYVCAYVVNSLCLHLPIHFSWLTRTNCTILYQSAPILHSDLKSVLSFAFLCEYAVNLKVCTIVDKALYNFILASPYLVRYAQGHTQIHTLALAL